MASSSRQSVDARCTEREQVPDRESRRARSVSSAWLLRDPIVRSRWSCVADSASTLDAIVAARIAALEAMVAEQQAALDAERAAREAERAAREFEQAAHLATKAERDRLREAYDALVREVELARRRLVVAKAERVDTAQLELEFATALAKLDALSRKAEEEIGEKPAGGEKPPKKEFKSRGRRDLRTLDVPEERIPIPDPLLDGKAARIGTAEESVGVRWKRGGFVRVVFERIKYDATKPAMSETPPTASTSETAASVATPSRSPQSEPATARLHARPRSSRRSSRPIRAPPVPSS